MSNVQEAIITKIQDSPLSEILDTNSNIWDDIELYSESEEEELEEEELEEEELEKEELEKEESEKESEEDYNISEESINKAFDEFKKNNLENNKTELKNLKETKNVRQKEIEEIEIFNKKLENNNSYKEQIKDLRSKIKKKIEDPEQNLISFYGKKKSYIANAICGLYESKFEWIKRTPSNYINEFELRVFSNTLNKFKEKVEGNISLLYGNGIDSIIQINKILFHDMMSVANEMYRYTMSDKRHLEGDIKRYNTNYFFRLGISILMMEETYFEYNVMNKNISQEFKLHQDLISRSYDWMLNMTQENVDKI